MVLGSVWFVIFWGALIWLVFTIVNRAGAGGRPPEGSPLAILQRRYARGEISKEEVDRMRQELS
jgi:putative membrane protein